MTSVKSTTDIPLDKIDLLDIVLRKYLPMLKEKKRSMIALHLSDIAGEISEDNLEELEISLLDMLHHMKNLKPLLKKAINALP